MYKVNLGTGEITHLPNFIKIQVFNFSNNKSSTYYLDKETNNAYLNLSDKGAPYVSILDTKEEAEEVLKKNREAVALHFKTALSRLFEQKKSITDKIDEMEKKILNGEILDVQACKI